MTGALLFLAAAGLAPTGEAETAVESARHRVEASASAGIRILRGYRLTPASDKRVEGAQRRTGRIDGADGISRPASFIEFE